jgi:hypothetical protein
VSSETLHVTSAQVEAAKLLIELLEEDGKPVDERLRRLADMTPEEPSAPTKTAEHGAQPALLIVEDAVEHAAAGLGRFHSGSFRSGLPIVSRDQLHLDIAEAFEESSRRMFRIAPLSYDRFNTVVPGFVEVTDHEDIAEAKSEDADR